MKKLLSFVLVLALVLSFAPVSKVHAADKTSAEALVNQAPTLVSDTKAPADGFSGTEVGRVVTFDHPLYGLTVEIAKIDGSDLILNLDLTTKTKEAKALGYDGCYVEDGTNIYLNGEMFYNGNNSVIIESREEKVQTDDYDIYKGKIAIPAGAVSAGLNTFAFKLKPNVRLLSLWPNDWLEGTSSPEFQVVKSPGGYSFAQSSYNNAYKVKTNSLTIGNAFKSSKKSVTESGSIIKYRKLSIVKQAHLHGLRRLLRTGD